MLCNMFKILFKVIFGLIWATILSGLLGAAMGGLELLTGVPFSKVWLTTGLGGFVDLAIYVLVLWKVLKTK